MADLRSVSWPLNWQSSQSLGARAPLRFALRWRYSIAGQFRCSSIANPMPSEATVATTAVIIAVYRGHFAAITVAAPASCWRSYRGCSWRCLAFTGSSQRLLTTSCKPDLSFGLEAMFAGAFFIRRS